MAEEKPEGQPGERNKQFTDLEKVAVGTAIIAAGAAVLYGGYRLIKYIEKRLEDYERRA